MKSGKLAEVARYTADKFIIDCGDSVSCKLEIQRILVPYDSSEFSENALDYAVYLANTVFKSNTKRQSIRIIILHVIQELPLTKSVLNKMTSMHKDEKPSLDNVLQVITKKLGT